MKNKDNTKRKLIDSVGEIFRTEGPSGLGVNKVARIAGVNKKLIYRYFTTFDELVEAYIVETDYWMIFAEKVQEMIDGKNASDSQKLVVDILQNQFRYFYSDKQMQKLITWEISANSPLMKSIHNARESMGQKVLEFTDEHFKDSAVNFRAVAALLVGGIYYTILHTRYNGGMFSDIDISTEKGREEIIRTIEDIIEWAYKA
jgi:AcrR family transcriptional regulator